jgi:hypothetical protein
MSITINDPVGFDSIALENKGDLFYISPPLMGFQSISLEKKEALLIRGVQGFRSVGLEESSAYAVYVVDELGNAVDNVSLIVTNSVTAESYEVFTDGLGRATISTTKQFGTDGNGFPFVISAYNTTVSASKVGYNPRSKSFVPSLDGGEVIIILAPKDGACTKFYDIPVISIPKEVPKIDFDFAGFTCDYIEYVFGNSADEINNDKSSFLLKKALNTDTIVFELWKGGEKKQDIIDNTLGEFYDGFAVQPLYVGVVIHWEKVLSLYGFGQYTIRAVQNIASQETTFTSRKVLSLYGFGQYTIRAVQNIASQETTFTSRTFQILSYSALNANNTVRIETYQQGYILNSDFDYRELLPDGWYQSFRVWGKFGAKTPIFESEPYLSENRVLRQNQDKIIAEYTLELEALPSVIHNQLIYDNMLANEVFITDSNILNTEKFERVSLYPKSIEEPEATAYNTRMNQVIKLVEKEQRTVKRNF